MNCIIKKKIIKISSILVLQTLISCSFNATYNDRVEDKKDAEKVTNVFYGLLRNEKYNDTYKLFSTKFFEVTDTSKLNNIYKATFKKLGAIDDVNLDHWKTHVIKGTDASANYILFFLVKRDKYESKEIVSLLKEHDTIKILGYEVNSDGFFAPDSVR